MASTPDDSAHGRRGASAPPSALAASRLRTLARLRAVVVAALVAPALAYVAVAAWLYREAFADAHSRLRHAASVAQEHALKLFDTNEMLLQRMLDLVGTASDDELLERGVALHQRLDAMAAGLPQVQGLFINGADARMVASNRVAVPQRQIDYSDREWYRSHVAGGPSLFLTGRIVSRVSGEAAFDMSRRRTGADGRFAGSVHVSLKTGYLTDFYRELARNDPALRLSIVRSDGVYIARWPEPVPESGRIPPSAPYLGALAGGDIREVVETTSPFDGEVRLRAFRRLGAYPVVVSAALDRRTVVAEWQRRIALLALFALPTALGFAGSAWLSLVRTRRELDAVQRLQEETHRRQQAELALLQSQRLEAMGRLTGGVAHDFNNVLSVIAANAEVLRRRQPALDGSPQLGAIGRAVENGARLTRQLLAFTRKQALVPERVDVTQRLPGLADLLQPLLGSRITLAWEVEPGTGAIQADPAELELALMNLAINAADAMNGEGRLTIRARPAVRADLTPDLQGDFVVIEVEDTGPGVPEALAERVFEPFFTTKARGRGTGLGLAQVRSLCQAAGGTARMERAPGGGARAVLLFARSPAAAERPAAPQAPAQPLGCRLLLVEDNDEVATSTQQLLEALGCDVVRAVSARDALARRAAAAEQREPPLDVVLSDIQMPGDMDGVALAGRLRAADPPLPVVLFTGYAERLEEARRLGLEVLPKPASAALLAEALRKAMAGRPGLRPATASGPAGPDVR